MSESHPRAEFFLTLFYVCRLQDLLVGKIELVRSSDSKQRAFLTETGTPKLDSFWRLNDSQVAEESVARKVVLPNPVLLADTEDDETELDVIAVVDKGLTPVQAELSKNTVFIWRPLKVRCICHGSRVSLILMRGQRFLKG